jgi:hypothetical protein
MTTERKAPPNLPQGLRIYLRGLEVAELKEEDMPTLRST